MFSKSPPLIQCPGITHFHFKAKSISIGLGPLSAIWGRSISFRATTIFMDGAKTNPSSSTIKEKGVYIYIYIKN